MFDGDEVLTHAGKPFTVFTLYKNAWRKRLTAADIAAHSASGGQLMPGDTRLPSLAELGFEATDLAKLGIRPGMSGPRALWEEFAAGRIDRYHALRDFPAVKGVSYLSVHLRFGTLLICELLREAVRREADTWLNELIWRSNGTAEVTAGGGIPGYTYLWSTTAITSSISGLTAGTYTVTVTDANGCTATCESIITQPGSAVTATCAATPVSCFGGSNGTAEVTAGGGTPGYTYLWSTTAVTSSINGLTAGTYTVTVTDANGCTATCESVLVHQQLLRQPVRLHL